MSDDVPKIKVRETFEVKKFEGDDQTKEPIEIITVVQEEGVVLSVNVWKKGDTEDATN